MGARAAYAICIAGKNNIAVEAADYLRAAGLASRENLLACPSSSGDGIGSFQRSFADYADAERLKIVALEQLFDLDDLIFVSLEFDRIVPVDKFASRRLFNVHFSALPKYKGSHTSVLPILHGDVESGVTLHRIDSGIDTGPIIDQIVFPIETDDTARDLYEKYISNGGQLFRKNIESLIDGAFTEAEQPADGSTYWPRAAIDYRAVKIELRATAEQVRNQIRAFNFREYQVPEVLGHEIVRGEILQRRSAGRPGEIVADRADCLEIATVDYDIRLYKRVPDDLDSTRSTPDA